MTPRQRRQHTAALETVASAPRKSWLGKYKPGETIMKLEASLKHFSPQGMHISDDVKKTGAQNNA